MSLVGCFIASVDGVRVRTLSLSFPRRWRRSAYEILTRRADPGKPAAERATLLLLVSQQVSGSVVLGSGRHGGEPRATRGSLRRIHGTF
ncbi:hypothetical protein GCM10011578_028580 [Streptomyces fuscichromogenes]|uniref:Uncharacterized protein n=1 Tax=Streptomyces fuscichromogenes TaxID=1324013 RepID=A0A917XBH1_9ACTN|nr:hypothetical protein GCM10011578_028580 [Streptomyces fuscichromogenes]